MPPQTKSALRARLAETRNTLARQRLLRELWHLERAEAESEAARTNDSPDRETAALDVPAVTAACVDSVA